MKKARALTDRVAEKSVAGAGGCIEWTGQIDKKGYGRIWVVGRGKQFAHRIAYELAYGPIADGMCICHKCDNRKCVNHNHLFVGTHADNIADMLAKGRNAIGEALGQTKLSVSDVEEIRSMRGSVPAVEIAKKFGVSKATVCRAQLGRAWTHIDLGAEYLDRLVAESQLCKNGHNRSDGNSYVSAKGNVVCRLCRRVSDKKRRDKNREVIVG